MAIVKLSPNQFPDVVAVLDSAMSVGGGKYRVENYRAAVKWRQRAYTFRKALREHQQSIVGPGLPATTKYDNIVLTIPKKHEGPSWVMIEVARVTGTLETLDGKPIDVSIPLVPDDHAETVSTDNDELAEAMALLSEKGK